MTKPGIDISVDGEILSIVESSMNDQEMRGAIRHLVDRVEQTERKRCAEIADKFDPASTVPIYDWYATKSKIRDLILANGETK